MCTRYPIINRVSELKVHIELTRFVQPEKIEIAANERAVNKKYVSGTMVFFHPEIRRKRLPYAETSLVAKNIFPS